MVILEDFQNHMQDQEASAFKQQQGQPSRPKVNKEDYIDFEEIK